MFNIIVTIIAEVFDWLLSGHILLSNEQIFSISRYIIEWWQILFYCLLILLYLLITHKICKGIWWWSKRWWINRTHVITYIFMFWVWLIIRTLFIHPSRSNIEENANIWAWKISEIIEYKEWNWYVLNFTN